MPISKVWIYRLLFVCLFVFCTVTYFSADDKASGVNFARRFIGVLNREYPIFVKFAAPEAQNRTNPCGLALADSSDRDATFVEYCAACGHMIGMYGYTAVPEDKRTCCIAVRKEQSHSHR